MYSGPNGATENSPGFQPRAPGEDKRPKAIGFNRVVMLPGHAQNA